MDQDDHRTLALVFVPEPVSIIIGVPGHQTTPRRLPTAVMRSTAQESSSAAWVAMTVQRSLQEPAGTVGGRIPWTNRPSSSNSSENRMVTPASAVMIGTIWVVPSQTEKPASRSSSLNRDALDRSLLLSSAPSAERTNSMAAREAASTDGGREVEKMKLRARLTRSSLISPDTAA